MGEFLERVYPLLPPPEKEACFRRMVRTAVHYNRYNVMYNIRTIHNGEIDAVMKALLSAVVAAEDPSKVVHNLT